VNFGTILKSFSNKCVTMVLEGKEAEAKSLSKRFVEYIQLKESLKRQFYIYTNLNSSVFENKEESELFLNETISLASNLHYNDLSNYNKILVEKFNIPKRKSTELDSAIENLIKSKIDENYMLINQKTTNYKFIVETLQKSKPVEMLPDSVKYSSLKILTPRHVNRIAIKKFNDEYKMFTESEKKIFQIMRSSDKNKELYFNGLLSETKKNINKFNSSCKDKELISLNEKSYEKLSKKFNEDGLLDLFELNETLKKYL